MSLKNDVIKMLILFCRLGLLRFYSAAGNTIAMKGGARKPKLIVIVFSSLLGSATKTLWGNGSCFLTTTMVIAQVRFLPSFRFGYIGHVYQNF